MVLVLRSLLELNDETGNKKVDINAMVDKVFREMGKEAAGYLTVEDFKTIMLSGDTEIWQAATFKLDGMFVVLKDYRKLCGLECGLLAFTVIIVCAHSLLINAITILFSIIIFIFII